jgi:hypothetical protein
VVQSAFHIGRYGPKDLQDDYSHREAAGQHADFGMARGYCRGRLNLQSSTDGYGKNAHPFRPNFKWLQGALIPVTTGDLVIPE